MCALVTGGQTCALPLCRKLEICSENIGSVPSPVHAGLCSWLLKRVQHDGGGVTAEQPDAQTAPIQSATSAATWFAASFSARATARGLSLVGRLASKRRVAMPEPSDSVTAAS